MTRPLERLLDNETPKRYGRGTPRTCHPLETLARLQPHLSRFGITRVANVTGLDRIGIPVFMVVRPNSRSLAVSQGKGVEPEAARVSGIMEAIELHYAEYCACPVRIESYAELGAREGVADPQTLPLARDSLYQRTHALPWTLGFDLLQHEPVWVPFELVHASTSVPPLPGSGCFVRSSNGLASGNTLAEAVLHGLCEVVERDAGALWHRRPAEQQATTRVDLDSVDDPLCQELLQRFERAAVAVVIWNLTSDVGTAVFRCMILDTSPDPMFRPVAAAIGVGCHPDRDVALVRALTEAAQSRLTAISGSRDDVTLGRHRALQSAETLDLHHQMARQGLGAVDFRDVPSTVRGSVEADIRLMLDRLRAVGIERATVVDLTPEDGLVAVARTVVPGLEGPASSPLYRPGRRARTLVP